MTVNIFETDMVLDADGVVYLPQFSSLLVADVHWGKAETFQKSGIPIPSDIINDDLSKLAAAFERYQPQKIIVLGDLIHSREGITDALVEQISQWRQSIPGELILIKGNHDRSLKLWPQQWHVEIIEEKMQLGHLTLLHEYDETIGDYQISGHLHPVLKLRVSGDRLRLPCFYQQTKALFLPAFCSFAGGFEVELKASEKIYLIVDQDIVVFSP